MLKPNDGFRSEQTDAAILKQRKQGWLFRLGCYGIAGILLYSSIQHIFAPYAFLNSIINYRILSVDTSAIVAAWLPYYQLVIALALLAYPVLRFSALVLAVPLFAGFLLVQASALYRGLDISCGCYGGDGSPIGWRSMMAPAAGLAIALIGLLSQARFRS